MGKQFFINNRFYFITLLVLIIFLSCASPYFVTHETFNSFRVKRSEEMSVGRDNSISMINSLDLNSYALESINPQAAFDDIILLLLSNKLIIIDILSALLLLYCQYRFIRRRNILVSQIKNKHYMVHYLQQKDGKKGASDSRQVQRVFLTSCVS